MNINVVVQGLGHVPSFKNRKRIYRKKLVTARKEQEWMEKCIRSLKSQLSSIFQTADSEMSPECLRQSAIASLPLDDNWQELGIGKVSCKLVKSGEEGAVITIRETHISSH